MTKTFGLGALGHTQGTCIMGFITLEQVNQVDLLQFVDDQAPDDPQVIVFSTQQRRLGCMMTWHQGEEFGMRTFCPL